MKTTRRDFVKAAGVGTLGAAALPSFARAPAVSTGGAYDVAVVGAGVFGAWIAHRLRREKKRVLLVDAYGPGNARSSSGGQTRVIRMAYGDDEIYTRWSMRSLELWKAAFAEIGRPFFQPVGVLWMARAGDPLTAKSLATLQRLGVRHERVDRPELERRWPQIAFGENAWAIHEPGSGFIAAFHAVQAIVGVARGAGVDYVQEQVLPPSGSGRLSSVATRSGRTLSAGTFVFAGGPWLPKLFPDVLGDRIFPTRQEVFYFGPPAGDERFRPPAMPVWADFAEEMYGIPDFKERGFKVALDRHGPEFDPDGGSRIVSPEITAEVRAFVARRFPALRDAPLLGGEVCQYENTSNGDFLVDRHPALENVWLVGGGSGHGFKHGPAMGAYVAERIVRGGPGEPRFALASKEKVQKRTVY